MLERERLESKKISKTQAVTSIMGHELPADDVYIGPSDYVPWLTDRKWAHIRLEGEAFGDVPLTLEAKLEVWDSPNSAGIVIDAVRCCKLALNHGLGGPLTGASRVPDEVAAGAAPGPGRAPDGRGLHRGVRRSAEAAGAEARAAGAASRPRPRPRSTRRSRRGRAHSGTPAAYPPRVDFAQVTPWPWEQHHEVNRFVERLSDELCSARPPRGGGRAVGLARADPGRARDGQGDAARTRTRSGPTRAAPRCSPSASRCRSGAAARCRCRSTCRARSRSCSSAPSSTSSTCTSRSRPARRRRRCATRAR